MLLELICLSYTRILNGKKYALYTSFCYLKFHPKRRCVVLGNALNYAAMQPVIAELVL